MYSVLTPMQPRQIAHGFGLRQACNSHPEPLRDAGMKSKQLPVTAYETDKLQPLRDVATIAYFRVDPIGVTELGFQERTAVSHAGTLPTEHHTRRRHSQEDVPDGHEAQYFPAFRDPHSTGGF